MKVLDIYTNELIQDYPNIPGGPYWSTQKYWDEYKVKVAEWGRAWERKFLYSKHDE
jgi:hypothetical protein